MQVIVIWLYGIAGIIGIIGTCIKYAGIKITHLADWLGSVVCRWDKWR